LAKQENNRQKKMSLTLRANVTKAHCSVKAARPVRVGKGNE
jgi:hypothetical protein